MYYSGNLEDDMPLGTKYFVVYDLEVEKILYFDDISPDKDEMDSEIHVDGDDDVRYSSSDPNVGYKMGSEIGVDGDICGDARIKMDSDDELDDYYIFSNDDVFFFCNEVKDEWINNLQVNFSTS